MPVREREHGELPSPTFVPVGPQGLAGTLCFIIGQVQFHFPLVFAQQIQKFAIHLVVADDFILHIGAFAVQHPKAAAEIP